MIQQELQKVAELLRLGDASNSALLSDNINSALVKNGLNAEDGKYVKADVSGNKKCRNV